MTPAEAYKILGLQPGAGADAAQDAYRRHALEKHPDRAAGLGLHDRAAWLKVRDAYECLRSAGFPTLQPAPTPPAREPKRYRAPEWLEQKWANEKPESLTAHLALDEAERRALVKTVLAFAIALAAMWGVWLLREKTKAGEVHPHPGLTVRW